MEVQEHTGASRRPGAQTMHDMLTETRATSNRVTPSTKKIGDESNTGPRELRG